MAFPSAPAPPPPPPPTITDGTKSPTTLQFNTEIWFDASYFKSLLGILRIVLIVLNIIGAICIFSSYFGSNAQGIFFCTIAVLGLIYSTVILFSYVFHVVEKYRDWQWDKIQMCWCASMVAANLVTSTSVLAFGSSGFLAAGFFGYLCMVLYALEAFLHAKTLWLGLPAQGHFHDKPHMQPAPV